MRLEKEAAAAGGKVIVLLGNHEGMNLVGFFRDVNPEIYAKFVDKKSEKRRKAAYKNFKKYWRAKAEELLGAPVAEVPEEIKEQWYAAIPPGWLEYKEALGPEAHYGSWLHQLPVAVLIDGVLFVHGGLGPDLAGLKCAEYHRHACLQASLCGNGKALWVPAGTSDGYRVQLEHHSHSLELHLRDGPRPPRDLFGLQLIPLSEYKFKFTDFLFTDPQGETHFV